MATSRAYGGGDGGGFTLGPVQNVFTGADRAAAEADRDAYDLANPGWIDSYDNDTNLNIQLQYQEGGDNVVLYQVTDGASAWLDNSSATGVQGDAGPAGATGNSYFFASISDRDVFFSDGTNSTLLKLNLPITLNQDGATVSYYWSGANAPLTYDPELWRPAAVATATSALFLGVPGASISNGGNLLNFNDAFGNPQLFTQYGYDDAGSSLPVYYELAAKFTATVSGVSGTTLVDPQDMAFMAAAGTALSDNFIIIPASSGTLRVQSWVGTDEFGPDLVDNDFEILPGDVGFETTLQIPNRIFTMAGQEQYVRFSGVQLEGGLQIAGSFTGQIVPFLKSSIWLATGKELVLTDDPRLSSGLGYVLATWGANLQTTGRFPAINGTADAAEIPSLGVRASSPVPVDGILDVLTYYNNTGDNTTELQIIKNGVVVYTFTCTGPYGVETGINVPIGFAGSVPDNIAIRYSAGTAPSEGLYAAYVS